MAAAALLIAPLAGHANSNSAMDACIKAFVSGNFPAQQPINVRKYNSPVSPLEAGLHTYTIQLTAKEKRTGREVAAAKCVADRGGVVIALDVRQIEPAAIATADAKATRNR